jgi:hypothetical protein
MIHDHVKEKQIMNELSTLYWQTLKLSKLANCRLRLIKQSG